MALPMSIRYVCLSDTHFGAENSILTKLAPNSAKADPDNPSAVLSHLIEGLRTIIGADKAIPKPRLLLNGDILELALATDNVAAMVFDRFIDLAFAPGQELFDNTILYVPGNHDHHLWETARELQYAQWVLSRPVDEELMPPWHVTTLLQSEKSPFPEAALLTALVQRRRGDRLRVQVVYPNFGVPSDDGERIVVFHHGHFVEPIYTLMSTAKRVLFPGQEEGLEVWDWESDNFAWIDFFWSCLGRSGEAGDDVGLVYDMLQEPGALAALAANLASAGSGRAPALVRPELRFVASEIIKFIARRVKTRERAQPTVLLSQSAEVGLNRYLAQPLFRQASKECLDLAKRELTFVFGHTHKPFEQARTVAPFERPIKVYNTGGWVVDTVRPAPLQGAAVVLVDDRCRAVSIRLYNQADTPGSYRVTISEPLDASDEFRDEIAASLSLSSAPWSDLSAAIGEAVAIRHRILPEIINRGIGLTSERVGGVPKTG